MSEIDLIPNDYRERILKYRALKIFSYILVCLILTTGFAYGSLEYIKRETNTEVIKLSEIKKITTQQINNLQVLKNEKKSLDYQWALLNGLRTAVVAEDLFVAIDRAIQDVDVWFSSMKFQRIEHNIEGNANFYPGYLIIVTPGDEKISFAIGTTMTIEGEAPNHSTLSTFVNNLIDQTVILDANVIETTSSNNRKSNVVKFNLVITVNLENIIL